VLESNGVRLAPVAYKGDLVKKLVYDALLKIGGNMNKANLKKYLNRFFILLIGVYIIYSIYIHIEYRHFVKQSIDRNFDILSIISIKGDNLANRLEEFVAIEDNIEVKSEYYNKWRIVNGESRNINSYLFAISTIQMGDESSDWDLLQYSLFRIDEFISGITNKFLEHQSYAISSEEKEKMDAVITVFRILSEEIDNKSDIEIILQSIKESMLIIDANYSGTLEQLGR
jgi:hypothetical protein